MIRKSAIAGALRPESPKSEFPLDPITSKVEVQRSSILYDGTLPRDQLIRGIGGIVASRR
jgi:hypothetical protein